MAETIQQQQTVPDSMANDRLDQAAARLFPDFSRSRLQAWIKSGELLVDGEQRKPRDKLAGGEELAINATLEADTRWQPEDIALDIVYEDEHILVLNKPAGLVVHPAAGHAAGTLLNALLNHCEALSQLPRGGIVHRLDRDTTGLMVVAKTLQAHSHLVEQLQAREVHREYEAVVYGSMTGGGVVDAPIGRHPQQRKKMAVVEFGGKEAITHYRLIKRFRYHSHVRCLLETGRTHQIRVHMAHIGHPVLGDPLYGRNKPVSDLGTPERQLLHACRLAIEHPGSGEQLVLAAPLPGDFRE
ncbi:MAG: 23S rRNA pseudouridine(1911/1915/1917) synthase RluD, partial [Oceanisphaera sp.]|nr:23S rRNA pseudouridine(1911/1915/1917) synthase RluD [Oceanisphaera sp.]